LIELEEIVAVLKRGLKLKKRDYRM
jgi:hypothetical protein